MNRITNPDSVASQVNSQHKSKVEENRSYLTLIIEMIMWLCKQGLPLRGLNGTSESKNRGNFLEFVKFQANYNPDLKKKK